MAVKTVTAILNGQSYALTLNAATDKYESAVTAPTTSSYKQPDHVFDVQLMATDDAGNTSSVDSSDPSFGSQLKLRVLETNPPTITPVYPAAQARIISAVPTIKWQVLDDDSGVNESTLGLSINGVVVSNSALTVTAIDGGVECSYTPTTALQEGENTIALTAADNDGNVAATQSVTFTVDTIAPSLNVSAPIDGTTTNAAVIHVIGSTHDDASKPVTVAIKVNGTDQGTVTLDEDGSFDKVITLTDATNEIVITATDAAGLVTTVTRTVVVDTVAPTFGSVSVTPNPVDAGMTFIISVSVTDL